jgi:hypothetical protein
VRFSAHAPQLQQLRRTLQVCFSSDCHRREPQKSPLPKERAGRSLRGYSRHATSSPRRDAVRILLFSFAARGKGQGAPKGTVLLWRHVRCWTCGRLPARLEAAFMRCRAALSSFRSALK